MTPAESQKLSEAWKAAQRQIDRANIKAFLELFAERRPPLVGWRPAEHAGEPRRVLQAVAVAS